MTPSLVNDLRVSFSQLDGAIDPMAATDCRDPVACVGAGEPAVRVFDAPRFRVGSHFSSPFDRLQRTWQVVNNLTWQRGNHYVRAGGAWERFAMQASWMYREPAEITALGTDEPADAGVPGVVRRAAAESPDGRRAAADV